MPSGCSARPLGAAASVALTPEPSFGHQRPRAERLAPSSSPGTAAVERASRRPFRSVGTPVTNATPWPSLWRTSMPIRRIPRRLVLTARIIEMGTETCPAEASRLSSGTHSMASSVSHSKTSIGRSSAAPVIAAEHPNRRLGAVLWRRDRLMSIAATTTRSPMLTPTAPAIQAPVPPTRRMNAIQPAQPKVRAIACERREDRNVSHGFPTSRSCRMRSIGGECAHVSARPTPAQPTDDQPREPGADSALGADGQAGKSATEVQRLERLAARLLPDDQRLRQRRTG